jgi:SAM-dependent methyltransferase
VSSKVDQYKSKAQGWSEREYADSGRYLEHRAELIVGLGPPLQPGDQVLDLACGDGGLGVFLLARGLEYRGVDLTPEMVDVARAVLGEGRAVVEQGDLDTYRPPGPVAATTLFRAIYYAADRRAFFELVRSYTTRKLVFDLNPRRYTVADVVDDLRAAGFADIAMRPFFVPQRVRLPSPAVRGLTALERSGPLARLALRHRFTYLVAAS